MEENKFRKVEKEDFNDWLPLFEKKEVMHFIGLDQTKSAKELCQKWFDKVFYRYENNLGGKNALIHKVTGEFVGQCGLLVQTVEGEKRLEVGYSILPKFWGQGYATEAAIRCKEFAFENNYCQNLMSIMHPDNIASEKVALKNGMTFEKFVPNYQAEVDPINVFSIDRI